eukprot:SAG22_NODE_3597_length_1625_cov_1.144168_1_plen_485_part_01
MRAEQAGRRGRGNARLAAYCASAALLLAALLAPAAAVVEAPAPPAMPSSRPLQPQPLAPQLCAYVVAAGAAGGGGAATAYAAAVLSRWLSAAGRCPVPVVAAAAAGHLQVAVRDRENTAHSVEDFRLQARQGAGGVSYDIAGGSRGVIYGAYELLERVLGLQFLAKNVTMVPQHTLMPQLPHLDIESSPAFEFRSLGFASVLTESGAEFSAVVRDNSIDWKQDAKPGQGVYYANPPGGCHTAFRLIPPAQHQTTHPDWFGGFVRDAKGSLSPTQLCWAAPGLVAALIEAVKTDLRFGVNRNATVVSVSQNDGGTPCNSSAELAVIDAEGSPAGPLLRAVNAVAEAIAAEFPYVQVDTLAYQFTLPPPRITKPHRSVIVRIGTMGANFRLPLNTSANAQIAESFVGWTRLATHGQVFAWHYVVNFPNYVSPFPNYGVMGEDLRFFQALGVGGVYEEGDGYAGGSDLAELKTYLLGKLLWDPQQDDA